MSAAQVLEQARAVGIVLSVAGGKLRYRGPREALTADLLEQLRAHKADLLQALAARAPVNLDEVLAAACEGVAGITPAQFRSLLSPEDLEDIAAGAIHRKTLGAYAMSFAEGMRSGRIAVPGGEP